MTQQDLLQKVIGFAEGAVIQEQSNQPTVQVPLTSWKTVAKQIQSNLEFDMLLDHAAVDWPNDGVIELVYQLYSTLSGHNLMISVKIPRANSVAPTVSDIWPIAQWQEREVFDLFGVKYAGHPDLRRLFLEDDWKGFPLLKDYQDDFILEKPW